jgi:hypothetical protein
VPPRLDGQVQLAGLFVTLLGAGQIVAAPSDACQIADRVAGAAEVTECGEDAVSLGVLGLAGPPVGASEQVVAALEGGLGVLPVGAGRVPGEFVAGESGGSSSGAPGVRPLRRERPGDAE